MPKIEYCNQCSKPKDKHFGDNCRCNFQWEYKTIASTPENEKLRGETPENEKLSTLPKKEGWVCMSCNKQLPTATEALNHICHSEPKEVVESELEKKIIKFYNATPDYRSILDWVDFIKTLLAQSQQKQKEELVEWCENNKRDTNKIQFIGYELGEAEGYNEALDNVIKFYNQT